MVAGFYTLSVGSVEAQAAPPRVIEGLARHPVPVMSLARLAVDQEHQRKGLVQTNALRQAQRKRVSGEGWIGILGQILATCIAYVVILVLFPISWRASNFYDCWDESACRADSETTALPVARQMSFCAGRAGWAPGAAGMGTIYSTRRLPSHP